MTFDEWQYTKSECAVCERGEFCACMEGAWNDSATNERAKFDKVLAVAKATVALFKKSDLTVVQTNLITALEASVAEVEGKL